MIWTLLGDIPASQNGIYLQVFYNPLIESTANFVDFLILPAATFEISFSMSSSLDLQNGFNFFFLSCNIMYSLSYIKQHPKKPSPCIKHLVVKVSKIYPLSTVILTSIKWLLLLSGHG